MKTLFKKYYQLFILLLIIGIAVFLRFYNLKYVPGWWPDEGVYLNIASNLLHGKVQMFSIIYPFVPHPPLFFLLSTFFVKIFGNDILALRILTSLLGIFLVLIVYFLGKTIKNDFLGLIAAFLVAVMPETVLLSRIGLPYVLLTVFIAIFLLLLYQYQEKEKIVFYYAMAFCTGLAMTTSFAAASLIIFLLIYSLYLLYKNKIHLRELTFAIGLCILPIVIYLGWALIYENGPFIHDLVYTFSRHAQDGKSFFQFLNDIFNTNGYFVLGIVGLLFLPKKVRLWTFLLLSSIIFTEYITRRNFIWFSTTYIFILYFGLASMLIEIGRIITESIQNQNYKKFMAVAVVVLLVLLISGNYVVYLTKKIVNRQWLEVNFNKNEEESFSTGGVGYTYLNNAISYINNHTNDQDSVLSSALYSWMINARPTDPVMSYIYGNHATQFFPSDMKQTNRFVYDPSYSSAKFLLDDKFMRKWFYNHPGIKEGVLNDIYQNWPKVFEEGDFKIYQNPNLN